jgi:hypothetical protein
MLTSLVVMGSLPSPVPPHGTLEAPLPPVRGFFFRRRRAIYGEVMNTIAMVALIAVIVLFTVLLLWGLWMQ